MKGQLIKIGLIIGLSCAAHAEKNSLPSSSLLAKNSVGDWRLQASASIEWVEINGQPQPYWDYISCSGWSDDMKFTVNTFGKIWDIKFDFHIEDKKGDRFAISYFDNALLHDGVWLYVDRKRWEYRQLNGKSNRQFSNWSYPQREDGGEELLLVYPAVRKEGAGSWMPVDRIFETLANAKSIKWAIKYPKLLEAEERQQKYQGFQFVNGWEKRRHPVRMRKIRDATEWCTTQVAPADAKVLSDEVIKKISNNAQTH